MDKETIKDIDNVIKYLCELIKKEEHNDEKVVQTKALAELVIARASIKEIIH